MTDWIRSSDGIEIAVDRSGPPGAPVVVLLHGGGQTRRSWASCAAALADDGFSVLNFDARGHGESDWAPDGHYTLDIRASDLRAVLGEGVCRPFALIGASLGGATAIHAVAQGLRPSALILVDLVPNAEIAGIARIREFMVSTSGGFETLDDAVEAVVAYNPERARSRDSEGLLHNLRRHADGRLYWHWDPAILAVRPGAMREVLDVSSRKLKDIAGLRTLLIRGLRSDVVSDASVAAFRDMLPALEVFGIEGAGHMVAGDRNDIFSTAARNYLRQHMPPR